jgi:hypothetical protein
MTDKARRVPRLCERGRADSGQAAGGSSSACVAGTQRVIGMSGVLDAWQTHPRTPLPELCG